MVHAGADLQEEAHQRKLVADRFEEQLLEQIARLQPVARVEVAEGFVESRIVFQRREHSATG
jgi:hypothetical protein